MKRRDVDTRKKRWVVCWKPWKERQKFQYPVDPGESWQSVSDVICKLPVPDTVVCGQQKETNMLKAKLKHIRPFAGLQTLLNVLFWVMCIYTQKKDRIWPWNAYWQWNVRSSKQEHSLCRCSKAWSVGEQKHIYEYVYIYGWYLLSMRV